MNRSLTDLLIWMLFPRRSDRPDIPNLKEGKDENLMDEALIFGNLYLGEQGMGKTTALARHRVEYDLRHPTHASFALDASGSYIDDYLAYAQTFPAKLWQPLKEKIIYVRLGDLHWVSPVADFAEAYGLSFDEQIYREIKNIRNLTFHMERDIHVLGGAAILPHLMKLLVTLRKITPHGEPFQTTDAPLFLDYKKFLSKAVALCGDDLDRISREFINTRLLNVEKSETELRTYALNNYFSMLSTKEARAMIGGGAPLWTPGQAILAGKKVLIDGSRLTNQQDLLNSLFTQYYALIKEVINKRIPHDPNDQPVALIIDEFRKFYKTPGLAEELAEDAPLNRSRKLQLYLVIQSLSQLDPELQEGIWLLLNLVCFRVSNKNNDALRVGLEKFNYNPKAEKLPAVTDSQNQVSEPEKGQDRQNSDWLTNLPERACIVKHYNHSDVLYIPKTKDVPPLPPRAVLEALKDELMQRVSIPLTEALRVADERVHLLLDEPTSPPKVRENQHITK